MVTAPNPFRFFSIDELQKSLHHDVSAHDLTQSVLMDLDTVGRRLNAIAEVAWEPALRAAADVDERRGRGSRHPFAGLPYGIKDVFATTGIPTRWSAPPFRNQVLEGDAAVVERLGAVGGIMTAKLASIQLAGAGGYRWPSTSLHGPGINPWGRGRWSGGSSSGPAIVVSAGILPFAIGSETTGSVVVPAAFCGVSGYRPSWGIVSQHGMLPVAWSLDKAGIIARSAAECRTVLGHIAGADARDPTSVDWRVPPAPTAEYRIGVLEVSFDGFDATSRRFDAAVGVLQSRGMRVRPVHLPDLDYQEIVARVLAGETAGATEPFVRGGAVRGLLDSSQRAGLRRAMRQPVATYARAVRDRVAATRAVRSVFASVDALVAPTSLSEAPPIGTDLKTWAPRRSHYGFLGALAGLPGISVPMGHGDGGLPLGLSIVADHQRDDIVLDIAEQYQLDTDWHRSRPGGALQ